LLYAPRSLKAPVGCKLSGLKYSARSSRPPGHGTNGVRSTTPRNRRLASPMSPNPITAKPLLTNPWPGRALYGRGL
jgi:hypothetical protein